VKSAIDQLIDAIVAGGATAEKVSLKRNKQVACEGGCGARAFIRKDFRAWMCCQCYSKSHAPAVIVRVEANIERVKEPMFGHNAA